MSVQGTDTFRRDLVALVPKLRRFALSLAGNAHDADDLMAANEMLARAFSSPMTEAVPPAIRATIEGHPVQAKVIAVLRPRSVVLGGLALAASVALAMVLVPGASDPDLRLGPVDRGQALYDHLQSAPSGRTFPLEGGRALTILASLPTAAGYCREVEVIDRVINRLEVALACTRGDGWRIEVTLSEPLPAALPEQGYVPAGGDGNRCPDPLA